MKSRRLAALLVSPSDASASDASYLAPALRRAVQLRIALLLLFAALYSAVPADAQEVFKVGGIYGLTGPLPDFGEQFNNGAALFLEHHRRLHKPALDIAVEDSRWEAKTAVSAFHKLSRIAGVKAVHVMGSSTSLAIKPLSEQQEIMLFSAGAHPDLLPGSKCIIRHSNLASDDAVVLAKALASRSFRRIACLYVQNDWGEIYQRVLTQELQKALPGVVLADQTHLPDESEFKAAVLKVLQVQPEALVVNSMGLAAVSIIRQARQLGFHGPIYANNGLVLSNKALELVGRSNPGEFYLQSYPKVPAAFRRAYIERFGDEPDYFALAAYTDLELMAFAATKAGESGCAAAAFVRALGSFTGTFERLEISPAGDIRVPVVVERWAPLNANSVP